MDARTNSVRDGHDTLFISASTAIKKSAKEGKFTIRKPSHKPTNNSTLAAIHAYNRGTCQSTVSSGGSRHAASANATQIARQVNCRTSRPWLRLYISVLRSSRMSCVHPPEPPWLSFAMTPARAPCGPIGLSRLDRETVLITANVKQWLASRLLAGEPGRGEGT